MSTDFGQYNSYGDVSGGGRGKVKAFFRTLLLSLSVLRCSCWFLLFHLKSIDMAGLGPVQSTLPLAALCRLVFLFDLPYSSYSHGSGTSVNGVRPYGCTQGCAEFCFPLVTYSQMINPRRSGLKGRELSS